MSRVLRWALVLSVLAHIIILWMPGLHLLDWTIADEPERVLAAELLPPPPPKKPKALTPPPIVPPTPSPVPPVDTASPSVVAPPTLASAPAAPTPPVRPTRALPGSGRVKFSVIKGDQGFVVGQAIHEWQLDGANYTLQSLTETTGLVALFRSVKITQRSRGTMIAGGLQPQEFVAERGGSRDSATFDWAALQLTMGNGKTATLQQGAQDFLSMFYQFALYDLDGPELVIMVTTGKKYERYVFQILGLEQLTLRGQQVDAYHLRTQASDGEATEVWLAEKYQRLPVKIRYTDRNGDSFELIADEISFQGIK